MTDLEMTKLCAEAMGATDCEEPTPGYAFTDSAIIAHPLGTYDPLHNDAQAMALLKRFQKQGMRITGTPAKWHVSLSSGSTYVDDKLNRAIVQCVATMQSMTQPRSTKAHDAQTPTS